MRTRPAPSAIAGASRRSCPSTGCPHPGSRRAGHRTARACMEGLAPHRGSGLGANGHEAAQAQARRRGHGPGQGRRSASGGAQPDLLASSSMFTWISTFSGGSRRSKAIQGSISWRGPGFCSQSKCWRRRGTCWTAGGPIRCQTRSGSASSRCLAKGLLHVVLAESRWRVRQARRPRAGFSRRTASPRAPAPAAASLGQAARIVA